MKITRLVTVIFIQCGLICRGGEIHSPGRHGDQIFALAIRKKIPLVRLANENCTKKKKKKKKKKKDRTVGESTSP